MPSGRRMKITALIAVLTVTIVFYVSTGARSTQSSDFYSRTVAAIKDHQTTAEREDVIAEEKARLERVEKLQREHDVAVENQESRPASGAGAGASDGAVYPEDRRQKPVVQDVKDAKNADTGEKSVAGRKKMKDDKVVEGKPPSAQDGDGVAKVGNVAPAASNAVVKGDDSAESGEAHQVEAALNDILKKGPIIIFSKSYCPYSKKAKHILLDLYTISPQPYVVELDQLELGSGLQDALEKTTGRRTVPNVLINGKSIGGGDDIEALHLEDKITDTVLSMGGKRIVKATKAEKRDADGARAEMKFRS